MAMAWVADVLLPLVLVLGGCGGDTVPAPPGASPRTYRLGFSAVGPRPEPASFLATVQAWVPRADIALLQTDVPWAHCWPTRVRPCWSPATSSRWQTSSAVTVFRSCT